MKKKIRNILILTVLSLLFIFFITKKTYEYRLEKEFYSYSIKKEIPKNKIRKTELIYFSKGNRYEYNVYLKNTNDDSYVVFSYVLPNFPIKSYVTQKIYPNDFLSSAYIEGAVVDLDSTSARPLIEAINK
ncbi:hypothetical protein [Vagococcus carniphilus]|uniref:hypothetical protein n=1 Tax=Vagococcus carniphilus TaxID=218144 RepID=UPI003B593FAD